MVLLTGSDVLFWVAVANLIFSQKKVGFPINSSYPNRKLLINKKTSTVDFRISKPFVSNGLYKLDSMNPAGSNQLYNPALIMKEKKKKKYGKKQIYKRIGIFIEKLANIAYTISVFHLVSSEISKRYLNDQTLFSFLVSKWANSLMFNKDYKKAAILYKISLVWNMIMLGSESPSLLLNYTDLAINSGLSGNLPGVIGYCTRISGLNYELIMDKINTFL